MEKNDCFGCGFNDEEYGCTCPGHDMWYACPIESEKPENIKALEEYADWLERRDNQNGIG